MFVSKLNAMDISAVLKLSWDLATNARMFVSKLNAKVADVNLKLSWKISHII